jgi:uncharacterized glyoxalase superfamily protein PhnB
MKLYTQLNFGGNCAEAFHFYEKHLGGKITMMMNQSQAPGAPSGAGKAIIHARMNIGDTVLIANDVPPSVFKKMRSVYLYLSVDSTRPIRRVMVDHPLQTMSEDSRGRHEVGGNSLLLTWRKGITLREVLSVSTLE